MSPAVRSTAEKIRTHLFRLLGGQRITDGTLSKIELLLDLVEQFAAATPTVNFHLHLSGYETVGKMFWVPIFQDKVVLDSPARRVLYLVYRYIESADSMLPGSTALLTTPTCATPGSSGNFGAQACQRDGTRPIQAVSSQRCFPVGGRFRPYGFCASVSSSCAK